MNIAIHTALVGLLRTHTLIYRMSFETDIQKHKDAGLIEIYETHITQGNG